jgi:hypothetical protein
MAHSFDTKVRWTNNSNPSTQAYTCGAGSTLLVLTIVVDGSVVRAGGAPTYNGVALTRCGRSVAYGESGAEMWFLSNPGAGTEYTISVPNTGTKTLYIVASSYIAGAGYTSVLDIDVAKFATSGANPSSSLTPSVNGDVIVGVLSDNLDTAPSARTHTVLYETDNGGFSDSHQYALIADTSATTMGWTVGSESYFLVLAAFKEVLSGTAIVIQPSTADTYINKANKTTNYGTATAVNVVPTGTVQAQILMSFDFSASVAAGATIKSAVLRLYNHIMVDNRPIACYRLRREDWVASQATWNIYKTSNSWGTVGALNTTTDHDTTHGATSTTRSVEAWQPWVVTDQVQDARDNSSGIVHFVLMDTGSTDTATVGYCSRDYTTDALFCPRLEIVFTLPALKTVNGLAVASVKTLRSGLAIASGKTFNGLA